MTKHCKKVFKLKRLFNKLMRMRTNMNKKGEPMSLGAVITIIILVILLVFVALALSGSFGSLGDYNPFGGGSNIDAVVLGCNTACDGNFIDSWCKFREVRFAKTDSRSGYYRCSELLNGGTINGANLNVIANANMRPGFSKETFPKTSFQLAGIKPCSIQCE